MFDGFSPPRKTLIESRPEVPNQPQVPLGLWQLKNFFKALQKIVSCQFVTGMQRPGEERCDAIPGSVQLRRIKSKVDCRGLFRFRFLVPNQVHAKIKL